MESSNSAGGYEDGYASCNCFWGMSPGSLVKTFIENRPKLDGMRVLDLGCGEGKNASAFAKSGARVAAVDCSPQALVNGRRAFPDQKIEWYLSEAQIYLSNLPKNESFDIIVMYGLLHCLPSAEDVASLVRSALEKTEIGGHHFVVAFNNGPHDLSAHPGFSPTLLPHDFYLRLYGEQKILLQSDSILHEIHPHNQIPHFHSLSRIIVRKER